MSKPCQFTKMESKTNCSRQWETENIDNLNTEIDSESEKLQEILFQFQSLKNLPREEKQKCLQQIISMIQTDNSKENLDYLLNILDDSLDEFIGDPRKFVVCISKILESFKCDSERTQNIIMRFLQEKKNRTHFISRKDSFRLVLSGHSCYTASSPIW